MQNIIMKDIKINIYFILIGIFLFISCKKHPQLGNSPICSFQNLICDYPVNELTNIKNVETFLLFGNPTDDTIKISLKDIHENYRHIYKNDTLKINLEGINIISIPPHDSLGVPCMSIVDRKFRKEDEVFKRGFSVINIKTKEIASKARGYNVDQIHDFQLYQKWGKKSKKIDL